MKKYMRFYCENCDKVLELKEVKIQTMEQLKLDSFLMKSIKDIEDILYRNYDKI